MADLHGWQSDPFGLHEQRYFSQGEPTKLVRDGGVESYDPPPTTRTAWAVGHVAAAQPPTPTDTAWTPPGSAISLPLASDRPPSSNSQNVVPEPGPTPSPSPGPGWWLASDGHWYPPETHPDAPIPGLGWWLASDGHWYPPETHPDLSPS
jgi:hypothetical protein